VKLMLQLLSFELKNMFKDPMHLFLLAYPLVMISLLGYVLPATLFQAGLTTTSIEYALTMLISLVLVLSISGFISGSLLGFSLLENKDEQTIKPLSVTPLGMVTYTTFKTIYTTIIGVFSNLAMLGGIALLVPEVFSSTDNDFAFGISQIPPLQIVIFSIVTSFMTPTIGALIAVFAKNKIEGFALVKFGGIIFLIPMLLLLDVFQTGWQYVLGILPNFWPVKAFLNLATQQQGPADLSYTWYMLIGTTMMFVTATLSIYYFLQHIHKERSQA